MRYTKEELATFAKDAGNCYEFLGLIGTSNNPGNYSYWKMRLITLDICITHWTRVSSANIDREQDRLVFNQDLKFRISGQILKKLMAEHGVEYKCNICSINSWNGEVISLHLDHINGNWRDNRLENLRLLCPNCHSQTETYCGKRKKNEDKLCNCGKKIYKRSTRCKICFFTSLKDSKQICIRRKTWPTKEDLEKLVWEIPTTHIAKKYGVSDKAVGGWCKAYGIDKPPRGYWMKEKKKQRSN